MQRLVVSSLSVFLLFLLHYARAQIQPTLQCGQITYNKVSFEAPFKGNIPTGKLVFLPIETFLPDDICSGTNFVKPSKQTPYAITVCANCSNCAESWQRVYGRLQNSLRETNIDHLIVLVGSKSSNEQLEANGPKNIHFAFIEGEVHRVTPGDCALMDPNDGDALRSFSKTSVLFVSISFIILMVISLAWLVFYYVQRFRYAHAKDRLQRRLFNAAKKALARIPTRSVRLGDKELDADCPVCIDPYRAGDIVRSLPCRHVFHKTCVDPWLLEHRTCPMCKNDILKAFGYHVSVGRRTQMGTQVDDPRAASSDADRLSVDVHSTGSESAFPFPVGTETHDPFSFTPSTSPQLVQVMHSSNARAFSIIPLTVHSAPSPSHVTERLPNNSTVISADIEESRKQKLPRQFAQMRRPNGHLVNLVHVRSRSLSHTLPLEGARPTATFRSNTFGVGSSTGVAVVEAVGVARAKSSKSRDHVDHHQPEVTICDDTEANKQRVFSAQSTRRVMLSECASVESL